MLTLLTKRIKEEDLSPRPFEVNGAMVPRSKEVASPIVTISMDDMDKSLRSIQEHGGTIVSGKAPFGTGGTRRTSRTLKERDGPMAGKTESLISARGLKSADGIVSERAKRGHG